LGGRRIIKNKTFGVELSSDARSLAQQLSGVGGVGRDSDHDAIDHVRVAAALALERLAVEALAVQTARDLAQRQFTERGKIARLEKILERVFDLLLRVNLPLAQSFAQSFHGHVDVNDLIGAREERI